MVNNGIPIWFRCFKGTDDPDAFATSLIKQGISFCASLFDTSFYDVIFLADRWFPNTDVLTFIQDINCFYCLRCKADNVVSFPDSRGFVNTYHISDINPLIHSSRVIHNVSYTHKNFKTNLVISASKTSNDEPWYIITNHDTSRAIRNYSYRFGSIEPIFKSQKSNGFRLESTNTRKLEHFISLFTIVCVATCWLTILGIDYSKNKHTYHLKIRATRKANNSTYREYSFFNLGLTIFHLCYYNQVNFVLKFNFILYDV